MNKKENRETNIQSKQTEPLADLPAQGQSRPLRAGMSGKAEIVIGSRSLIEYVFEPLRQLKENSSDVPDEVAKR